jgi:uncharacterized protein YqeY
MSILEQMRLRMRQTMKASRDDRRAGVEKSILRVAIAAIDAAGLSANQAGKQLTDDLAVKEVRKIITGNEESLAALKQRGQEGSEQYQQLGLENEILGAYLPQSLNREQIHQALAPVLEQIKSAKGDGPATGIAMKHLKTQKLAVEGTDVAEVVKKIRS